MQVRRLSLVLATAAALLAGCSSASPTDSVAAAQYSNIWASVSSTSTTPSSSPSTPGRSTGESGPTTTAPTQGEDSRLIDGLLADSDEKGFAATYIGGLCDGAARLAVTESPQRIDLSVLVGPDPTGDRSCPAMGISRTVTARLTQPIGARPIFSGGIRPIPFDGARRLTPSTLPPHFTVSSQQWGGEPAPDPDSTRPVPSGEGSSADAASATTRWTATYTQPQQASNRCTPTRGLIEVDLAPAGVNGLAADGWSPTVVAQVGAHQARLWRAGSSGVPRGWAYVWQADQGSVQVLARVACEGDRILDAKELLEVAKSLRPS